MSTLRRRENYALFLVYFIDPVSIDSVTSVLSGVFFLLQYLFGVRRLQEGKADPIEWVLKRLQFVNRVQGW